MQHMFFSSSTWAFKNPSLSPHGILVVEDDVILSQRPILDTIISQRYILWEDCPMFIISIRTKPIMTQRSQHENDGFLNEGGKKATCRKMRIFLWCCSSTFALVVILEEVLQKAGITIRKAGTRGCHIGGARGIQYCIKRDRYKEIDFHPELAYTTPRDNALWSTTT